MSVRIVILVVGLLVVTVACGGSSGPSGGAPAPSVPPTIVEPTVTPTPVPPPLILLPIKMSLTDLGDGWQNLVVDLAISNTSQTPMTPSLPDNPGLPEGSISIKEGRDYDLALDTVYYASENKEVRKSYGTYVQQFNAISFPPGLPICGLRSPDDVVTTFLQAVARIPQGTTPNTLMITGYPTVSLASSPDPNICQVNRSSLSSQLPLRFTLSSKEKTSDYEVILNTSVAGELIINDLDTNSNVVHAEIHNLSKLDEFRIEDLYVWAVTEESAIAMPRFATDDPCATGSSITAVAGPSQTEALNICFQEDMRIAGLIIQSPLDSVYVVAKTK